MPVCKGKTSLNRKCKNKYINNEYCWRHIYQAQSKIQQHRPNEQSKIQQEITKIIHSYGAHFMNEIMMLLKCFSCYTYNFHWYLNHKAILFYHMRQFNK